MWYSNLKVIFLDVLCLDYSEVTSDILARIDSDLSITNSTDPEVKVRWFFISILSRYDAATSAAGTFVSQTGRVKYLYPLYTAMKLRSLITVKKWYDTYSWFYTVPVRTALYALISLQEENMNV